MPTQAPKAPRGPGPSPPPPPEAELIRLARDGMDLSVREAARRASMSHTRWAVLERGWRVSPLSGNWHRNTGTARVIARMAMVVGLGPKEFISIGRADVAAKLIRRQVDEDMPVTPEELRLLEVTDLLSEVKDLYGEEIFQAAYRLLQPPPAPQSINVPSRTR